MARAIRLRGSGCVCPCARVLGWVVGSPPVCLCGCGLVGLCVCFHLDVVAVVDQEVRGLEVAMDEPLAMQVVPAGLLASTHAVPLAMHPVPHRQYSKYSLAGKGRAAQFSHRSKEGRGLIESPASAGAKARRRPVRKPGLGRHDRRWAELLVRTCPATRPSSCAASAGR